MRKYFIQLASFLLISFGAYLSNHANAQVNSSSPAIPFGSKIQANAMPYDFGMVPTNLPTGTYAPASNQFGKSQDAYNAYVTWKTNYVSACGSNFRVKFDNNAQTVSEGIAYGMLIAAYAADKPLFDGLWGYYKQHSNANGVMNWRTGTCSPDQSGGATDAELDAAMALLVAKCQWPSATSPYTYSTEATTLINNIMKWEIHPTSFQAINGDGWGFGNTCRNPSYQSPAYYRQYQAQTGDTKWASAVTASYNLLNANRNTTTGLISNWSDPNGAPNGCNGPNEYGYDACRNPWRMATDYIWYGTATAQTNYCNPIAAYTNTGTRCGGPVAQAGGTGTQNATFVSTFAAGVCGASTSYQSTLNALYTKTVNTTDALPAYFGNTLRVISLFMMTGNFWKPCQITSSTTSISLTAPTNGGVYSEGDAITLSATATASSGSITGVEFYVNNVLVNTDNSSPYSYSYTAATTGSVDVYAKAINSNGETASSALSTVTVYKAITQASSAPTIDGTADAVWSNTTSASLTKTISGTISSGTDLSANYKAMWDATNLYILVNVTDDVKTNNGGTDNYNDDAVEVFIDIGNNKSSTYGANDFQYTFRWNDATIYNSSGGSLTGITFAQANTGTGYVMEIKMPWSTLTGSPTLNQLVGFEVEVNDDDDGGARDGKLAWNASADNAWQNPSYMGTAILKGSACTLPGAAGTITGSAAVCANATSVTYSIAAVTGATSYTWTVPTGATITAGAGTTNITVTFGTTAGNVTVTPVNACGNGTAATRAVTINAATGAAGAITGSAAVCANATGVTYSIAAVTGATSYNWTVPTGATITAGAGTTNITVTFGTTAGNVTVTPVGACGNGTAATRAVTINAATGAAGAITGSAAVCANATGVTYSIAAVTGATSYNWTVPTGATITAGAGTTNITVTFGTTAGNVTVTPVGACGNGTAATRAVTINAATGAAGAITGSAAVCANATGVTYSIAAVTGATSYSWTVPTGATITAGAGTTNITVTMGSTAGNVTVTPVNACGNGTAATRAVTINAATGAAGAITGSAAVCANATGITYSIAAVTGATSYNWTVPTGATITAGSGTNSITVTMGSTAGNVTVTPVGACGNGTSSSKAITINAATGAAGTITGSTAVCANATGVTYSIATVTGATSYNWTVPTGATITAGSGTNSITVTMGSTAGNVTVTPVGSCGNGTSSSKAITINAATGAAGTITGSAAVCANAIGITYSIATVTGATSYNWTVPTGATITAGSGTNSITVTMGSTAGNVTVTPVGSCGNGTSSSKAITINAATGAAGTITGSAAVCANATGITYSIATVTGATSYNWTVPTGATITAGSGTNSITVTMGSSTGNVTVTPVGACGNGTSSSKAITINAATGAAGTITGTAAVCANATGVTYSIATVTGATSYNWTVPTGATITAGSGTNSITVTMGSSTGNVTVTPVGACGNGTSRSIAVTVSSNLTPSVTFTANPGTTIYSGQSVTFTATPTNGGTSPSYIWKINNTVVSGQTSNTFTTSSLANNNVVSVQVVSSLTCVSSSTSAAATKTMTVTTAPFSSSVSGPALVNVNQTNVTYSVPAQSGFTYNWTVPAGATIVSGQGTNSIVVDFGSSSGNVSVTESVTNGPSKTTPLAVYVSPASLSTTNVYGTLEASIFPIPCESTININLSNAIGEVQYTIYEVTGNEIEKGTFVYNGSAFEITAPSASGTYLIKLETDSKTSVLRFVKK